MKHKNGYLFCQSLIELKFKDIRLRRVLKKIDSNLASLIADPYAALIVLSYANMLPSADMQAFVDYCKKNFRICLGNQTACKIFAKVYGKVSDVERLEIELHLKNIMPQVFDAKCGRELVEVFLNKADNQSIHPLLKRVYSNLEEYIRSDDFEYFFNKVSELKKTEIIDEIISRIFFDRSLTDNQILALVNNETPNKVLLKFFTLSSFSCKDKLCNKLAMMLKQNPNGFTPPGLKLLSLCDFYFSSQSPVA